MGLIGISLIVASLVCFCIYPQALLDLSRSLLQWRWQSPTRSISSSDDKQQQKDAGDQGTEPRASRGPAEAGLSTSGAPTSLGGPGEPGRPDPPVFVETPDETEEPTTPKASAQNLQSNSVPAFSLSAPESLDHNSMPPPMFPSPFSAQRASGSRDVSLSTPSLISTPPPPSAPDLMAPPPLPSARHPHSLSPAASTRNNSLPVPNRGLRAPSSVSFASSLGPPPTTEVRPARLNARSKVILTPGHSPLDWARLIADPHAKLRNLPPSAPQLLRVTPSMLKQMNGRRGNDAWTALGGMVYNISPYVPFHPGGAGELLRCAGRDGNRLFNEVHSWVNYDNMLAACRVGILVDENESLANPMEEVD